MSDKKDDKATNKTFKKQLTEWFAPEHIPKWIEVASILVLVITSWYTIGEMKSQSKIMQDSNSRSITTHTEALEEMQKQSNIMKETGVKENRAYVWIDIEMKPRFSKKTIQGLPSIERRLELTFFNEGNTPAYPIFVFSVLGLLDQSELDLRKSLCIDKLDSIAVTDSNNPLTFMVKNMCDKDFTQLLLKDHPYPKGVGFPSGEMNRGSLYAHTYFLYKDVYGKYHDSYFIREFRFSDNEVTPIFSTCNEEDHDRNPLPNKYFQ